MYCTRMDNPARTSQERDMPEVNLGLLVSTYRLDGSLVTRVDPTTQLAATDMDGQVAVAWFLVSQNGWNTGITKTETNGNKLSYSHLCQLGI